VRTRREYLWCCSCVHVCTRLNDGQNNDVNVAKRYQGNHGGCSNCTVNT